ncbi:MAG: winged helix-turn-helix domain-containing protein [Gemmobacter sp.]
MAEFRSVEIDFDVHKRIELARESFSETPNEVLRRLLGLDASLAVQQVIGAAKMRAWSGKGVQLPHGTRLRMDYNGRTHEGEIVDGLWIIEGERFSSPSAAAGGVARTKDGKRTNLDGWIYWWALLPSEGAWVKLSELRSDEPVASSPAANNDEREIEVKLSHISTADLPPENEVMAALETLLRQRKRAVTPSEAYKALADEFTLTTKQRSRLMKDGRNYWENRVQWARKGLVDAGIMAREPRGIWSIAKS